MLFVYLPFTGYLLIRYQFSSNPTPDQSPEMLPFVAEMLPFAMASLSMLALVDVVMFAISKPVACYCKETNGVQYLESVPLQRLHVQYRAERISQLIIAWRICTVFRT